jgi:hypothetical protein
MYVCMHVCGLYINFPYTVFRLHLGVSSSLIMKTKSNSFVTFLLPPTTVTQLMVVLCIVTALWKVGCFLLLEV